ncbi:unnamed protein product [Mytilus coruscus]|uniref:Tyr recombinase domain-containing protein n=1 Tax=Mytilus coruscus TaxID=42192 RepID=A0A6J8C988_MYTCO|nr:unnamed protein product [Mytilus coruscus]
MLKLKAIALAALTTASRAQTLSALDKRYMGKYIDRYIFYIQKVLKTSRPGVPLPKIYFIKYDKPELCVYLTLEEYVRRTRNVRKCDNLFISYRTFNSVTTRTLARWLKVVLRLSGVEHFSAHSFRSTSTSVAYGSGVSLKEVMNTANWSSSRTFYRFYHKEVIRDNKFAHAVLNDDN